jgi:hypothetical protein
LIRSADRRPDARRATWLTGKAPGQARGLSVTRRSWTLRSHPASGVSIALIGRRAGVPWPATPSSARQRRGGSTGCPSHGLTRPGPAIGPDQTIPPHRGKPRVPGPRDRWMCPVPGAAGDWPIRRPVLAGAANGRRALRNATRRQHRARFHPGTTERTNTDRGNERIAAGIAPTRGRVRSRQYRVELVVYCLGRLQTRHQCCNYPDHNRSIADWRPGTPGRGTC